MKATKLKLENDLTLKIVTLRVKRIESKYNDECYEILGRSKRTLLFSDTDSEGNKFYKSSTIGGRCGRGSTCYYPVEEK